MRFKNVVKGLAVAGMLLCAAGGVHADVGDYGDYTATHYNDNGGNHAVHFSKGYSVFGSYNSQASFHFDGHAGSFSYQADRVIIDGDIYNAANGNYDGHLHFEFTTNGLLPLNQINPKLGGTSHSANWARNNWDFYNLDVANSSLTGFGTQIQIRQAPTDLSKPLQVGFGANDKPNQYGDFGASSWFQYRVNLGNADCVKWSYWRQGDINIDLLGSPAHL